MMLVLDLLLVMLLAATVVYCFLLNRQLTHLRAGEGQLRAVIGEFGQATAKAEAGIANLRGASDKAGQALETQVQEARRLLDDITFATEAGSRLADRLAAMLEGHREPPPLRVVAEKPRSEAERELVQSLRDLK